MDFSSEACRPCKAIAPVFQKLAKEFSERAIFATVDVDQAPAIRNLRSVVALPTFQAIEAQTGTDLFCMEGADEGKLRALVHQVLGGDKEMKWQECNSCGDGNSQKK